MDFLADVWVTCPVCEGQRFNRETLQVRFKGKSIADVLEMDVQEALEHFENVPKIRRDAADAARRRPRLHQARPAVADALRRRGPADQAGPRAGQARAPARRSTSSTSRRPACTSRTSASCSKCCTASSTQGNTVLVIEHNLDVIKTADWLIDLGPEGGAGGGRVVAAGTPEAGRRSAPSRYTGQALAPILRPRSRSRRRPKATKQAEAASRREASTSRICGPGRPAAQPQGRRRRHPARQDDRLLRPERVGQVFAGDGHDLRRGAAAVRREPVAATPGSSSARCRSRRSSTITGLSPAIASSRRRRARARGRPSAPSPRSTTTSASCSPGSASRYCPTATSRSARRRPTRSSRRFSHLPEGTKLYVMAPVERQGGEKYDDAVGRAPRRRATSGSGSTASRISLDEPPTIDHRRKHRSKWSSTASSSGRTTRSRLADAVEAALDLGKGVVHVAHVDDDEPTSRSGRSTATASTAPASSCGRSFEQLIAAQLLVQQPARLVPGCEGLGIQHGANPAAADPRRHAVAPRRGASPSGPTSPRTRRSPAMIAAHGRRTRDSTSTRRSTSSKAGTAAAILHGTGDAWFDGRRPSEADATPGVLRSSTRGSSRRRGGGAGLVRLPRTSSRALVDEVACAACMGARLRDDAAAVRFRGRTLDQIGRLAARPSRWRSSRGSKLDGDEKQIAGDLLREIRDRLKFLVDVGLDYLTLGRRHARRSPAARASASAWPARSAAA